jgi:hypothetical protein
MEFIQMRHGYVKLQAHLLDAAADSTDVELLHAIGLLLQILQHRIESLGPIPEIESEPCPCGCDS